MAKNNSKSSPSSKFGVRKDLFGAQGPELNKSASTQALDSAGSALGAIWGESNSNASTQRSSNSILLSPDLKRTPNRFSTSPSPKKKLVTPKKPGSTPRKLSKYSPFRKKVYNADPKDSIKNFFVVKEKPLKDEENEERQNPLGIEKLDEPIPSTSTSAFNVIKNCLMESQECSSQPVPEHDDFQQPTLSTPVKTPSKISLPRSNSSTPSSKKSLSPNSKITGPKDIYAFFLLRIVTEAMMTEVDPDNVYPMFSTEEKDHIGIFNKFDQPTQRLYARLLNRKIDWIRVSSMKYGDVDLQLMLLEQNKFLTTDCSNETLDNLLNLLKIPELKSLCKSYKLAESGAKADLISRLMSRAKQRSIKSFFAKASDEGGENTLRKKIYEQLGLVIKVCSVPQQTFLHCLLLFSYPHFRGLERDRFSDQLALVSSLNNLTFPPFEVIRTIVFPSRDHFLEYKTALEECSFVMEAKEAKNWDVALDKLREIVKKLQRHLSDQDNMSQVEMMPDFLRRFTATGCYVRAVSSSIDVWKKREDSVAEAEASIQLLLSQRLYNHHRRGQWYEQLALLYSHNLKDNVKATQAVLTGLRDEYIDEVSKHVLCARASMLEGRKKNGLKDYLKDALAKQKRQVEALQEPPTKTITEQVLIGCRPGLKQVYVRDSEDGKMLSSVEEVAREHFREEGYTHGAHDEGSIIKSIIFACFWDEIYGIPVWENHGLFHSEYQNAPLDWKSESFFERRKHKLKEKLQDLAEGGVDAVLNVFQDCFAKHMNEESVVNWKLIDDFEIVKSLIECLDIDVFLSLSRLLLRSCRTYGAGFPDLTLWNPAEKKCIFVEVKSPNDHLSMKQRVWLHSLNKMGANAIVCHVQSVGCKSQKRKSQELGNSEEA